MLNIVIKNNFLVSMRYIFYYKNIMLGVCGRMKKDIGMFCYNIFIYWF